MSYAQAALKLSKESEERPNDIISKNGLRDSMNKLKVMQEELKAKNDSKKAKRELNKLLKELPVMEEQPVEPSMQEQTIDPMSMIQQPQIMAKGGHLFATDG
jgi:intergrase/recombinase